MGVDIGSMISSVGLSKEYQNLWQWNAVEMNHSNGMDEHQPESIAGELILWTPKLLNEMQV